MEKQVITLHADRQVTLTAYLQQAGGEFRNIPKRPAIIVLPGGGYDSCSDREADPPAMAFLKAGYHVFILRYSVKPYAAWPQPLQDYEEAMRLIRSHASEWSLIPDRIAVCGFSAGGHLAGAAATMAADDCRPDAAILVYAALNKTSTQDWNADAPAPLDAVDEKTPPCFLACARDDSAVPALNTLQFAQALYKADISFETHVYAFGGHGFSVADSTVLVPGMPTPPRLHNWVQDSLEWLSEVFGDFGDGTLTSRQIDHYCLEDHSDHYSFNCTVGQIRRNKEAEEIIAPVLAMIRGTFSTAGFFFPPQVLDRMKVKEILSILSLPGEKTEGIEKQLEKIRK